MRRWGGKVVVLKSGVVWDDIGVLGGGGTALVGCAVLWALPACGFFWFFAIVWMRLVVFWVGGGVGGG